MRRLGWAILWLPGTGIGFAASPPSAAPKSALISASGSVPVPAAVSAPPPAPRFTPVVPSSAPPLPDLSSLPPLPPVPNNCLGSGDGYFRARLGGAIDARINWPNKGTRCQGEPRDKGAGVRLSFQRASSASSNLLFVFGITGVREGKAARDVGVNLTVIVQGTNRIYSTLGDSRCTVDSLSQRPLKPAGSYRVEARGFCTQPAHAVRGRDAVLVSTFEFAGLVVFGASTTDTPPAVPATVR